MNPQPTPDQPSANLALVQAATRDPEYWFAYGNCIVLSQGVAFRISRGPLAEHSAVFRRAFDEAAPRGPAVYGCLLVVLDDSPDDLRELFGLICPSRSKLNFDGRKIDMSFISGIIRLGDKYELDGLYDEALGHLTTYYTTSFDAWADGRNAARWQPNPADAIRAINLARLTDTPSILPAAFYICAMLSPADLVGFPLEDGSREKLTLPDKLLVSGMKAHLIAENAHTAFLLFRPPRARVCWWKGCCSEVWTELRAHGGLPEAPHPVASARALDSWIGNADSLASAPPVGLMAWWYSPRTLCNACRNRLQARDRELRREVWRKLPQFLGLTIEGWDAT